MIAHRHSPGDPCIAVTCLHSSIPALLAPAILFAATAFPPHPTTVPDIVAADVLARDKAISDDVFQGRGPGTQAGEAAAQWIADEMKRIGLKPGDHGSYFQKVPSVNIALDASKSSLSFATPSGAVTPNFPEATVYWTPRYASADVDVKASPLVFVGYGVVAPEYQWNDYAGLDVKGKTVVILINDPGNEERPGNPAFFKGRAMTYYGRWTYKFEEAARQGAAAAIIVHETAPPLMAGRWCATPTPATSSGWLRPTGTSPWSGSRAGSRSTRHAISSSARISTTTR